MRKRLAVSPDAVPEGSDGSSTHRVLFDPLLISHVLDYVSSHSLALVSRAFNQAFWKYGLVRLDAKRSTKYLEQKRFKENLLLRMREPLSQLCLEYTAKSRPLAVDRLALLGDCFQLKLDAHDLHVSHIAKVKHVTLADDIGVDGSEMIPALAWQTLRMVDRATLPVDFLNDHLKNLVELDLSRTQYFVLTRLTHSNLVFLKLYSWNVSILGPLPRLKFLECKYRVCYEKVSIEKCPKLMSMTIASLPDTLTDLSKDFPALTHVTITAESGMQSFTPFRDSGIQSIRLTGKHPKIKSLDALSTCKHLHTLFLKETSVRTIAPLKDLPLKELTVPAKVRDLSPLATGQQLWTRLQKLFLNCLVLHDLHVLSSLQSLQDLHLQCDHLDSLEGIEQLQKLDTLTIHCFSRRRGLKPHCCCTEAHDIAPLAHLPLKQLDLNFRTLENSHVFRTLHELQTLRFGDSQMPNLRCLKSLPNLERLRFSGYRLRDLNALVTLPKLREVDIRSHRLHRVGILANIRTLESFFVLNDTSTFNGMEFLGHLKHKSSRYSGMWGCSDDEL